MRLLHSIERMSNTFSEPSRFFSFGMKNIWVCWGKQRNIDTSNGRLKQIA